ncbi:hypothetical protein EYZ11_007551 [Aspergillus tanneri]|uniref:FAD-binding PCMH-type domain-containing protein n=1 Tax=Aspergillus tanneri TaxID=1220188 RepID=A0A4S3JCW8_9EURO|nr:uncharacterized protein ATNIH1004_004095 [Aspergillus tanneri]KAA8648212.1 hypothetical protein ATNIH1004_004095 [Aspergillus tanneri]THC92960.1 hypothetical protein EYZ11_007551 [Aspergillus tanneri]
MFWSLIFLAATAAAAAIDTPSCRCTPSQPCWPSDQKWQTLNESVSGHLITVRPVAWPCHDPTLDPERCQALSAFKIYSSWRREQPGALQYPNWEALPSANQSCYFDTDPSVPCGQGRISEYSVVAETVEDIQAAVRFARDHGLRLVVKNTGHDFLGRSAAPHSLQIATYKMRGISFSENFVPKGAPRQNQGVGSTVTIQAGAVLNEIYQAVQKKGKMAVLGGAHTVGAAGGYIQGGGHSPIGAWKGMASDNAVEFEVITADGERVIANQYQHRDLFWALRGGGGGTFGIVTRVTLRTFDEKPAVAVNMTVAMPWSPNSSYWDIVAEFSSQVPRLNDELCSGYLFMLPKDEANGLNISVLQGTIACLDQSTAKPVDQLFDSILAPIRSHPGVTVLYNATAYPTTYGALNSLIMLGAESDITGGPVILGSRLISRDFLRSSDGSKQFAHTLSQLPMDNGAAILAHLIAGGQVQKNAHIESALNPVWRKTGLHIVWTRSWTPRASEKEIHAVKQQVSREVEVFRALEPEMGAYLNEAYPYEEDFQRSFWGENYGRLYAIKQTVDPRGLFIARKGVGSEDWDEEGFCRV